MDEMLRGGVIMDVVTPDQAEIAEDAGAVAVTALECVPADIQAQGHVSRMSDPYMIDGIIEACSHPGRSRVGTCSRRRGVGGLARCFPTMGLALPGRASALLTAPDQTFVRGAGKGSGAGGHRRSAVSHRTGGVSYP